jgi:hypothetical protein
MTIYATTRKQMKQILIISVFLLSTNIINAQNALKQDSPECLVNQFFAASSFTDKANYFIDEMAQQTKYPSVGEELGGNANVKIRKIEQSMNEAVFTVNVKMQNDQKDFYCYLKNQNGWKISAIRTFIIPAYYHQLADSILSDPGLPDSTKSIAHSIRLLTGTDEKLMDYLKLNFDDFKRLTDLFHRQPGGEIKPLLQKLNLSSIYKPDQLTECFFLSILELNYLEAGFIYCPDKSSLPKINPNEFIIIEEVVKDWYLYRRN